MDFKRIKKDKMKKITAKIVQGGNRFVTVFGKIKETRSSYGRKEYLVTGAKADDFWVSESNVIMKDE